jgi:predicted MFS family arabinose efflux permease
MRNGLTVLLLACSFGMVFLARNALGYLSPFLVEDLHLQNQSIGLLASAYSLAWALSGFAITTLARGLTQRALLTGLLFSLGIASIASSMAATFLALLLARLASGFVSGPALPLVQSYAAPLGSSEHRGLRMGIVQGLGSSLIGTALAPVILVPIAVHWGWRGAFLPIAALAVVCAMLLLHVLPTQAPSDAVDSESHIATSPARHAFAHLNIILCSLIGAAMIGWLMVSLTFYPLYLIKVRHHSPAEMSALMSLMGIGGLMGAFLVPYLSDRFGRRRIMILFALIGVVSPLGILLPDHSLPILAPSALLGSLAGGTIPLFMAVIPSDTVSARRLPATIGLIQGVSELAGGVALPVAAGWAADKFGLHAPLLITLAAALLAALFALSLKETSSLTQ